MAAAAFLGAGSLIAAPATPLVLAVTGQVTSEDDKAVTLKSGVVLGETVSSGEKSGVIIRPVPGQLVVIDSNTKASIVSAEVTPGEGGATRASVVGLTVGHLHSAVAEPQTGSESQAIETTCARIRSERGSWSTWADDDGAFHVVAYAGTVDITIKPSGGGTGAQSILLRPGQIATWRCEGDTGKLEVVDMRTGIVTEYQQGVQTGHRLATAAELQAANALLVAGISAFRATDPGGHHLEFAQITNDINRVLGNNGLGVMPPITEWYLFPQIGEIPLNFSTDFASPEQP